MKYGHSVQTDAIQQGNILLATADIDADRSGRSGSGIGMEVWIRSGYESGVGVKAMELGGRSLVDRGRLTHREAFWQATGGPS